MSTGLYNDRYDLRPNPARQRLSLEKQQKLEIAQLQLAQLTQQTPRRCDLSEIKEIYTNQKVIANSLSLGGDIYNKYKKIIMQSNLLLVDRTTLLSSLRQMLIDELTASLPDAADSEDGFMNALVDNLVTSTSQVYIRDLNQSNSGVQIGGWSGINFLKSCVENTGFSDGLREVMDKGTGILKNVIDTAGFGDYQPPDPALALDLSSLRNGIGQVVDYTGFGDYQPPDPALSLDLSGLEKGVKNVVDFAGFGQHKPYTSSAFTPAPRYGFGTSPASGFVKAAAATTSPAGWTPAPIYGYGMSPVTNIFGEKVTQTLVGTPVSDIADFISKNVTSSNITDFAVGTAVAQAPHIGLDLMGKAIPSIAPATKLASNAISTAQYAQSAYALSTAIAGWSMLAVSGVAAGVFLTWWLIKKSKLKKLNVPPEQIKSIEQNLISNLKTDASVNEKSLDDLLEKEIAAIETVVPAQSVEQAPPPCISEDGIKQLSEIAVKNVTAKKAKKVKGGPANKFVKERNAVPPTVLGSKNRKPLSVKTAQRIAGPGVKVSESKQGTVSKRKTTKGGSAKTRKNKKKSNKKLNNNKKKSRRQRL